MIRHLKKDNGFSCDRAQRDGQSIVVADVEKEPDYALYRNAVKEAGFRSVQSTPFVTEDGKLIGIVTVHFERQGGRCRVPERPSISTALLQVDKHISCSGA